MLPKLTTVVVAVALTGAVTVPTPLQPAAVQPGPASSRATAPLAAFARVD